MIHLSPGVEEGRHVNFVRELTREVKVRVRRDQVKSVMSISLNTKISQQVQYSETKI